MPGPVFRGQCVKEIVVPQKTVCQNDCERCGRTWFSDDSKDTARVVVSMMKAGENILNCSFNVLCDSCEQTVHNLLKSLAKSMTKTAPRKSRAKKDEAPDGTSPPEVNQPEQPAQVPDLAPASAAGSRPPAQPRRVNPAGPSTKQ